MKLIKLISEIKQSNRLRSIVSKLKVGTNVSIIYDFHNTELYKDKDGYLVPQTDQYGYAKYNDYGDEEHVINREYVYSKRITGVIKFIRLATDKGPNTPDRYNSVGSIMKADYAAIEIKFTPPLGGHLGISFSVVFDKPEDWGSNRLVTSMVILNSNVNEIKQLPRKIKLEKSDDLLSDYVFRDGEDKYYVGRSGMGEGYFFVDPYVLDKDAFNKLEHFLETNNIKYEIEDVDANFPIIYVNKIYFQFPEVNEIKQLIKLQLKYNIRDQLYFDEIGFNVYLDNSDVFKDSYYIQPEVMNKKGKKIQDWLKSKRISFKVLNQMIYIPKIYFNLA
jgi:hypothetical protein